MPGYLRSLQNVEAFLRDMEPRLLNLDKKYDLEGAEVNLTVRRVELSGDIASQARPKYISVQTWIDRVPNIAMNSIIPGAGLDWPNGVLEKKMRVGLAILVMLQTHQISPKTMIDLMSPDGEGNYSNLDRWTGVLQKCKPVKSINGTFLSTCGALVLRVMKSPEYRALSPDDRDDKTAMMNIFGEYTNCKLILGAVMYPWRNVLNLMFLFGPRANTVEGMRIQESVIAWLHAKVKVGMWMVYHIVFDKELPVETATPLAPVQGWELGLYRPWKAMIDQEPLKTLLGDFEFTDFPVRPNPNETVREAPGTSREEYLTHSIAEIHGPARIPL